MQVKEEEEEERKGKVSKSKKHKKHKLELSRGRRALLRVLEGRMVESSKYIYIYDLP